MFKGKILVKSQFWTVKNNVKSYNVDVLILSQTLILVGLVDWNLGHSSYTAESLPATIRRAKDTDLHPIGPNFEGEVEFKHHMNH